MMIILITFYLVSMIEFIYSTKLRNSTEEASFGIPGTSTEHEINLRVKPIVERNYFFLLQIDRYSCD